MKFHKFFLMLIAASCIASASYGQQESKESYKKYKSRKAPQESAPSLLKDADAIKNDKPGEALDKVEEALGVSVAQGDSFNEAKSYVLMGEINENIQEWKLALDNYTRAYEKLKGPYAHTPEFKNTLRGLGNTNLQLANYTVALTFFQEALTTALTESEKQERLLDISETYYRMGNYLEAGNALEDTTFSRPEITPSIANRLENQKTKIAARSNDLSNTKNLYPNSLNAVRAGRAVDPQEQKSLQSAKEEIVEVLREQKKYDDEIDLRKQSIEYNLESNNLAEVAQDKVEIAKTLHSQGENSAAIQQLEEATRLADTINNPKAKANAYLTLAGLYEKSGRSTQALNAYRKYSEAVQHRDEENEERLTEKSELIKKQQDIEELTSSVALGKREATIEQATVAQQRLIIYGLLLVIFIIAITSYFIYKNARASKIANQLLALKSLRSQMNPHFIFNALNSVNQFIAQQDERTANKFLSEFSQLMRLVLENSQEDFIPLQKEQEILSLYLKLEHYRFRDKFDYEIKVDEAVNVDAVEVPPMLIQPYIENAVWHGLRYKTTKGKLLLHVSKVNGDIVAEITDDGIGRKKSEELKTENQKKHNSTGLKNIAERLSIINKVYRSNYRVSIEDVNTDCGTRVKVYLPIHKTSGAQV